MERTTLTDISLEYLFEERTEDPCEQSTHLTRPRFHEEGAPGVWLVRGFASCHGGKTVDILVCDKFKRVVITGGIKIFCLTCEQSIEPEKWYTILGRKGVDF